MRRMFRKLQIANQPLQISKLHFASFIFFDSLLSPRQGRKQLAGGRAKRIPTVRWSQSGLHPGGVPAARAWGLGVDVSAARPTVGAATPSGVEVPWVFADRGCRFAQSPANRCDPSGIEGAWLNLPSMKIVSRRIGGRGRANLEICAGSGNFFRIRRIFFPDRVAFGLSSKSWRRDNRGWRI
jgi:hypothetical protein